ncbi:MAG: hypothetical protein KKF44_00895 [Nanoarchaeota archaeon]|nr:hypothetical protein [Nanoarchaeota archaeon]
MNLIERLEKLEDQYNVNKIELKFRWEFFKNFSDSSYENIHQELSKVVDQDGDKYYHLMEEFERFHREGLDGIKALSLAYTSFNFQKLVQTHGHHHGAGIVFYDIGDVLLPDFGTTEMQRVTKYLLKAKGVETKGKKIGGLTSRGVWDADWISKSFKTGTFMIRKAGKLPGPCLTAEGDIEYGHRIMQVQDKPELRGIEWILADDLSATGGSIMVALELAEQMDSKVTDVVLMSDINAGGMEAIAEKGPDVHVFMQFSKKIGVTYKDDDQEYNGPLVLTGPNQKEVHLELQDFTKKLIGLEDYHVRGNQLYIERIDPTKEFPLLAKHNVIYEFLPSGNLKAVYLRTSDSGTALANQQAFRISFTDDIQEEYAQRIHSALDLEIVNKGTPSQEYRVDGKALNQVQHTEKVLYSAK